MEKVVIVSGCRTAVGAFGGALKDVPVVDLGALVLRKTMEKAGLRPTAGADLAETVPGKLADRDRIELEEKYAGWDAGLREIAVDEVIMGNVLQAGQGQNPARQATIRAGIAKETPAFTINKVCGSGLKAIALAAQSIMTGQAEVVLAGGQENMSQVPMALMKGRWGYRMELTGVGEIHDEQAGVRGLQRIREPRQRVLCGDRREIDQLEVHVLPLEHARLGMLRGERIGAALRAGSGEPVVQQRFARVRRTDERDLRGTLGADHQRRAAAPAFAQ